MADNYYYLVRFQAECEKCGAAFDGVIVDNVTDYRDYSAGTTYDECTRCHVRRDERIVNTM